MKIVFEESPTPESVRDALQSIVEQFGVEFGSAEMSLRLVKNGEEVTIVDDEGEEVLIVAQKHKKQGGTI